MRHKPITVGDRFGRLVVVATSDRRSKSRARYWSCVCDCGNGKEIEGAPLKSGATRSCGCLHREAATKISTKHNMSHSTEYQAWSNAKARCGNPKVPFYKNYGGRGITVCERWLGEQGFANFLADMGRKPDPKRTLDRIDNNGNYEPSNCRWATRGEQAENKRSNRVLVHDGRALSVTQWAVALGISRGTIFARLRKGATVARALKTREATVHLRSVIVYSDGSYSTKSACGGWGVFIHLVDGGDGSFSGPCRDSSSQRCELLAAIEALKILLPWRVALEVELVSDSQYVIFGVTRWRASWEECGWQGIKNPDLWKELLALVDRFPHLSFRHVRGHRGVPGNEEADRLATKGRLEAEGLT